MNLKSLIRYRVLLLMLFTLLIQGCGKETAALVTNLHLDTQISDDGSGIVNFTATADNADRYYFNFGLFANDEGTRSNTGKVSYKYNSSGTYNVKVTAYSADNLSSALTKPVSVTVIPAVDDTNTSPENYPGMNLAWRDEFNGSSLNTSDWTYDIGTGINGWGNNELQYYRHENLAVANGQLTITAKRESFGGREFTSSRIKTQDKKIFRYGRIDIRAKLPKGKGIWPALWMLGNNINTVSWPACGEIDIMELVGGGPGKDNTVHGTIHYDNNGSYANIGKSLTLSSGDFSEKFHVYSIIWEASSIKWLVDNVEFHSVDISSPALSEFNNHFFLLINLAVGGNWPGSPDTTTAFPQELRVDYVRVFQK